MWMTVSLSHAISAAVPYRESARRLLTEAANATADAREHIERSREVVRLSLKLITDLQKLKAWFYTRRNSN
jgi:hypothetical protein